MEKLDKQPFRQLSSVTNYEEAVSYIMRIPRFSGKNTKEMTEEFYRFMKEPGSKSRILHVAGTNGKGSVCAFFNALCLEMGKTTGVFTSPHLVDIRERISFGNQQISKEDFFKAFIRLRTCLTAYCRQKESDFCNSGDLGFFEYHPSFFEFLFFIAMLAFEEKKPQIIILETGLGGRLDATNAVSRKEACVITEIGYDHMEYLGETLEKIAGEKAGILQKNIPVIYWKNRPVVTEIIEKKIRDLSAEGILVSKEDTALLSIQDKYIDFSYKSRYYEYIKLRIKSRALYQMNNAALALTAAERLFSKEELTREVIQKGIFHMQWQGRMDEVAPGIILDGAHNEDGISAFLQSVQMDGCRGKRSLLFSAVSDKQFGKMAEMIKQSGLFEKIGLAQLENVRGLTLDCLKKVFSDFTGLQLYGSIEEAFQNMTVHRGEEDLVYVVGSLYLVGQVKSLKKENPYD